MPAIVRSSVLVFAIAASVCVRSFSEEDQFTKLGQALGPELRPSLIEVRDLQDEACRLRRSGNAARSADLIERAVRLTTEKLGPNHPDLALLLAGLAEVRAEQGDFADSATKLRAGLEIARSQLTDDHPVVANLLMAQASLLEAQGKLDEALALYTRCLTNLEKSLGKEHLAVGLCRYNIGSIYSNQYKSREALTALEQSRSIIEKVLGTDHFVAAQILEEFSSVFRERGDYDIALDYARKAESILQKAFPSDHLSLGECSYGIGWIYLYRGDYADAERLFRRALRIIEAHLGKDHRQAAVCLDRLAEVQFEQGEYTDALQLIRRSLGIKEKAYGQNHPLVANSYEQLGDVQQLIGQREMALKSFGLCLKIRLDTLGKDHPSVANAIEHLASAYLGNGNYSNALTYLEMVLQIREKVLGVAHPHVAVSLAQIAHFWYQFGQTLTSATARTHCIAKSVALQERCIGILQETCGPEDPETIKAQEYLAAMLLATGDLERAMITDAEALMGKRKQLISQLPVVSQPIADREIKRWFESVEIFQTICNTPTENNPWLGSSLAAERLAMSKALLEEIQTAKTALSTDGRTATAGLQSQYQTVCSELARLGTTETNQVVRESKRRELHSELDQIENDLAERGGLVAQIIQARDLALADIARALPMQAALLDFIQYRPYEFAATTNRWKGQRYAAYLTFPLRQPSTNVLAKRVDLGDAALIDEAVKSICKRMTLGQYAAKDLLGALERLSDLVYTPLSAHLTNVSHLIICPDGQLSRLPFEMLPVGNKFLIEEKTITYVTSGREVLRLATNQTRAISKPQAATSLVMGNPDFDFLLAGGGKSGRVLITKTGTDQHSSDVEPSLLTSATTRALSRDYRGMKFGRLPGAEAEARSVAKLLGNDTTLRLGAQAREADLKAVQSPRVLHLATHGFFLSDQQFKRTNALQDSRIANIGMPGRPSLPQDDWENPLVRCGLALAGANRAQQITNAVAEDGLLTGLEASSLNLQGTELVILSACDSGSGEVKIGEGVMSLRRAFRIAGAETVLASHWKVSDKATTQLMTEFIRRWRAGEPRAKAWRQAQLSLLRTKGAKEDFSNPFFWAAFTLTGQWN